VWYVNDLLAGEKSGNTIGNRLNIVVKNARQNKKSFNMAS
jgi:septum formation topological specificity factor MinE